MCFPIRKQMTWGRTSTTGGSGLYVWNVLNLNGDRFGPPGRRTWRMTSTTGSGESIDRWFTEGVGIVQQVNEHHGTYDEDRRRLLKATINGKTQEFHLTPARTVPFGPVDCEGVRWRHFLRADGTVFRSLADCQAYTSAQQ
jgi:hypothetical protein